MTQYPLSKRILQITTVPMSLRFLKGLVNYQKACGFDVQALSSPGSYLFDFAREENVTCHQVNMPRRITPLQDLIALFRIWKIIKEFRPMIVHTHTPKGGLLGTIGAWMANIPVRIYHIHGLPMETASGPRRQMLAAAEKASCHFATQVLCVGHELRELVIRRKLCPPHKIKVLGKGSIGGIDAKGRFNPTKVTSMRSEVLSRYGVPLDAFVVGFVGRLVRDKGLQDLILAWQSIRTDGWNGHLLVVGPFEERDSICEKIIRRMEEDSTIHLIGSNWDTPPLYAAMDIAVLPTYREGLPLMPLEAAAMKLPVIVTDIPGCRDVVQHEVTGLIVPVGDANALQQAILRYWADSKLRQAHGDAARELVVRDFDSQTACKNLVEEYQRLIVSVDAK